MRVFISHKHEDTAAYSSLCLALDLAGVARWDPDSMTPGEPLGGQLQRAIEQCEQCILVATPRSLESRWCLAEVGAFWGAGKRVIGFIADPDVTESELPPQFRGNLWTDDAQEVLNALAGPGEAEWVTRWSLGSAVYRERLRLDYGASGRVSGERVISKEGGSTTEYRVTGYREAGFWWLEYHDEADDDVGGGTILARRHTDWKLAGVVVSVDCDNGHMRCQGNQWVRASRESEYQLGWQVSLGEFK